MKEIRDDLQMLKSPGRWPCWPWLPVKRRTQELDNKDLGVIPDDGKKERTVYHVYLFDLPDSIKDAPKTVYPSNEALLADGWEVD